MKSDKILGIRAVKLVPVAAAIMMVSHIAFLLYGVNECLTEILMVSSGFFIAYIMSRALGFCRIHRALIYYPFIVMCCIWWEREGLGFGASLTTMRMLAFAAGIFLLSVLFIKVIWDNE